MDQPEVFSRFADEATESRYNATARRLRIPFVRMYCGVVMLATLGFIMVNPHILSQSETAMISLFLGLMLMVAGCYFAATFWSDYERYPIIDFVALLLLAVLVNQVDFVIFEFIDRDGETLHVIVVINRLMLTAFAALTLAGRPLLFLMWLAADAICWAGSAFVDMGDAGFPFAVLSYLSGAAMMFAMNLAVGRTSRSAFQLASRLDTERHRNEQMVFNMLPQTAVHRIREGQLVADSFADASVVFIDMVGFSNLAKRISPGHLVEVLNSFFNHADACALQHGVEKVKTIGDSYLAVAGGNQPCANSADAAIIFARAVLAEVSKIGGEAGVSGIALRVGIHSGPLVGGVIGVTRMAYDYWGDTVNMAARLQNVAPINGIAISESTWLRTRVRAAFGAPQLIALKGVGEVTVFCESPVVAEEPVLLTAA